MASIVGRWMFAFGIASFFVAASNIASIAQMPMPDPEVKVVNECIPSNNGAIPRCEGRCVQGSTSWSCTPGTETRIINGVETDINVCYCE